MPAGVTIFAFLIKRSALIRIPFHDFGDSASNFAWFENGGHYDAFERGAEEASISEFGFLAFLGRDILTLAPKIINASNQGGSGLSKKYEGRKIVLILGAGSTRSERPTKNKPPLDKNFFKDSLSKNESEVEPIRSYFKSHYNLDICSENERDDSLEAVMVKLFADSNDPSLGAIAYENFLSLIKLFNKRLADTTNRIKPNSQSKLVQVMVKFLDGDAKPENISIITFNQDIQIEKTLDFIEGRPKYKKIKPLLNFRDCYGVDFPVVDDPSFQGERFEEIKSDSKGIEILKLHGSLNWYSVHRSGNVKAKILFKRDKKLYITGRKEIDPEMKYKGNNRMEHTLPVIVPPVPHKSAIFPSAISDLWVVAEERLNQATDVVIFGYSCPEADHESSNLIQRTLGSRKLETFSIIDPSPEVFARFLELTKQERVFYYSSADAYIDSN